MIDARQPGAVRRDVREALGPDTDVWAADDEKVGRVAGLRVACGGTSLRFADHRNDVSARNDGPLYVLGPHLLLEIVHRAPPERKNRPRRVLAGRTPKRR